METAIGTGASCWETATTTTARIAGCHYEKDTFAIVVVLDAGIGVIIIVAVDVFALLILLTTRQVVAVFRPLSGLYDRSRLPPLMMRQRGHLL